LRGNRASQPKEQAESSQNDRGKRSGRPREGLLPRADLWQAVNRNRSVDQGLSAKNLIFCHGCYYCRRETAEWPDNRPEISMASTHSIDFYHPEQSAISSALAHQSTALRGEPQFLEQLVLGLLHSPRRLALLPVLLLDRRLPPTSRKTGTGFRPQIGFSH
jgi:hypothetical protein